MSGLFSVYFALCQPPGRVLLIQFVQAHMRGDQEGGLCNCVSFLLQNANAMKITSWNYSNRPPNNFLLQCLNSAISAWPCLFWRRGGGGGYREVGPGEEDGEPWTHNPPRKKKRVIYLWIPEQKLPSWEPAGLPEVIGWCLQDWIG